jgi:hypothetical protein
MVENGADQNHFSMFLLPFFRVLYHLMDMWYNKGPTVAVAGPKGGASIDN